MPRANLTDLFIRKIAPDERTIYWDESLPAFGVRVGARAKVFIVMRGQTRKKTTIGKYPALSLQQARRKAGALIFGAAPDDSPSTTLATAVGTFLDTHPVRTRTIHEYDRLIRRHFVPSLGSKSLASVRTRDITAITDTLASTPAEQIHAHAALSAFFSWALGRQLITANPMQHLSLPCRPGKRDRVLSDDELVRVYRAAQDISYPFGFIVLICIHLGMRRSEAASLKWSYITADTINLPAHLTKNNTPHAIPNLIGENLALIPRTSDYLFPSTEGTVFNAWSKNKARLDAISGVRGYVLHDLRRTFSTIHARIGTPPHVTEAILNHKTGVRTPLQRIYDRHDYLPQMRAALQNYERFLRQLSENV